MLENSCKLRFRVRFNYDYELSDAFQFNKTYSAVASYLLIAHMFDPIYMSQTQRVNVSTAATEIVTVRVRVLLPNVTLINVTAQTSTTQTATSTSSLVTSTNPTTIRTTVTTVTSSSATASSATTTNSTSETSTLISRHIHLFSYVIL